METFVLLFLLPLHLSALDSPQLYEDDSCIDERTKTPGRCVLLEACESAKEDLQSTPRRRPTHCSFTPTSELVCCRDQTTPEPPPPAIDPRLPETLAENTTVGAISAQKCQEYNEKFLTMAYHTILQQKTDDPTKLFRCDHNELVVDRELARIGEIPHMAALGWANEKGGYTFLCGGSLVSPRFVLTAAHCMFNSSAQPSLPVVVRLGFLDLDRLDNETVPLEVTVKDVHIHPKFKNPIHYDDIALVELATEAEFTVNVRPSCLWTKPGFEDQKNAQVVGWSTVDASEGIAGALQKAKVSFIDNKVCNVTVQPLINQAWGHGLEDTQMCAGEPRGRGGSVSCKGGMGFPLHVALPPHGCTCAVIAVGTVGPTDCATLTAAYTRVYPYLSWIEALIWPAT